MPANSLDEVRQLAAEDDLCEFFGVVLDELRRRGLDSDDLREIIQSELGDAHYSKSKETERYHPGTTSDYFSIWIDECGAYMFLKLLVRTTSDGSRRLVVTSFKVDDRHAP